MVLDTKVRFCQLIERYHEAKSNGNLNSATEETIRMWINELLDIFGWDVQDTQQVQQERRLNSGERNRLLEINSHNTRPDYTLVNGVVKLCFIDAKNLSVNIHQDSDVAFQIRSYGWSIGAQFSIVTNFEEIAIYDCQQVPIQDQSSSFARLHYYNIADYIENFETIYTFLNRDNVINNNYVISRSSGDSPDEIFADFLCSIRVRLANSILESNDHQSHGNDPSLIGLWVQIIINRILFIRVCESKGLEEEGLLQQFAEQDFWENFKNSSYLDFYEHYDGPIFSRIGAIHNLHIDNAVFAELLNFLYYPSPYRFDVLPVKSISDIYDIFLARRLAIVDGVAEDTIKDEYRKTRGAVVTPTHIVRKVIDKTMPQSYLDDMSLDDLLLVKVLDPACGSGVFLAELYDTLSASLLNKLQQNPNDIRNLAVVHDNELMLTLGGKRVIINNCLYGIDIDQEAVEVARMSMSLKVVESCLPTSFQEIGLFGHQILNGIGENIKCGNTLVDEGILTTCPSILNDISEIGRMKIFNWQNEFEEVANEGGFDFVIGNPPYVEVKNYNRDLPTIVNYIKRRYVTSSNGKIDLAIPFIEKGLEFLKPNGRLGYIIQKRFFKTDYGKGIRRFLAERNILNSIYDYSETNLFKGRITYVAVMVCDMLSDNNACVEHTNSANQTVTNIPLTHFGETPWDFSNIDLQNLRFRLLNLGSIKTTVKLKVGIQVLWDRAYQIKASCVTDNDIFGSSGLDQNIIIEKEACRAIICNNNISPFTNSRTSTYAIFPYDVVDSNVDPVIFSEIRRRYPNTHAYLSQHKTEIEENVVTAPSINTNLSPDENWHLYTRVQNHSANYAKVCIPMTTRYPTAIVVNEQNVYCDNANMFFVEIPNATEVKMYALAAIVNSNIFSTLARSIANPQQGGYYKFNKQFLDPIPFPKEAFEQENGDIIELCRIGKQIEAYNLQITSATPASQASLLMAKSHLWGQVDSICDRLYEINNTEREILYSEVRNDR